MDTQELLKKVRKIEITTKGLSRQIFAGEYHSAFKGRGMTFSEVREYQYGDEIRNIDWNVTARFNAPHVKVFEEERELTVMLLVDVSASNYFGTTSKIKRDLLTELAAILSFSAGMNNDKVGIILFSNEIELFIPPKKGRSHTLRIIREILSCTPKNRGTNISVPLRYLTNVIKRRCSAFILSDMLDVNLQGKPLFENALRIASSKHDIGVIKVVDKRDKELPNVGIIEFRDAETNKIMWVDTALKSVRQQFSAWKQSADNELLTVLNKVNVDNVEINTQDDFVLPLIKLFHAR